MGRVTDALMQLGVNEIDEQGIGEEDGRRIVRFVRVEVRAAGEGVRSGKETAWDMDDLEIKIHKIEQSLCLVAVEILGLTEVRQVFVICEHLNGERGAMEVVPPGLQGMDDCEEFPVIDVVIAFGGNE